MITVYQSQGTNVTPLADAKLYELLSGGGIGVVVGCEITSLGGLQLRVGAGWILLRGRWIKIEEEVITVQPSSEGQVDGQLLLHLDVSSDEAPGIWATDAQTPLPSPVQEDINGDGTIYEMRMCTYKVDQLQVTELRTTFKSLSTAVYYLYKAIFNLDAWTGEGPYTQTVPLTPVDGGPAVTANSASVMAGIDNSLPAKTKTALRTAVCIINRATRTLGAGTISVSAEEKPNVDAEIYFWVKKGE